MEAPPLQEGDAVWLHNPQRRKGLTPKLQQPWQGPYIITKKINDLVYRIQLSLKAKPKVVHRNRLWKYSGSVPNWHQPENATTETQNTTADAQPDDHQSDSEPDSDTANTPEPRMSSRIR